MNDAGEVTLPQIQCGHQTRCDILYVLQGRIYSSYKESVKRITRKNPRKAGEKLDFPNAEAVSLSSTILKNRSLWNDMFKGIKMTQIFPESKCNKCRDTSQQKAILTSPGENESSSCSRSSCLNTEVSDDKGDSRKDLPVVIKRGFRGIPWTNSMDQSSRRSGQKTAPEIPDQKFTYLPDDLQFDDYYNGPTLEDLKDDLAHKHNEPQHTIWEAFKDYGFRIEPSFAMM